MAIFLTGLLTVLKILGIAILSILGILVFLILLVLFVPIRYKLEGTVDKSREPVVDVTAKITWLLHLLNVLVSYSDKLFYRARIIIFTIISSEKKDEPLKTEKKKRKGLKEKQSGKYKKENIKDKSEESTRVITEVSDRNEDISTAEYSVDWNEPDVKPDEEIEDDSNNDNIEKKSLLQKVNEFIDVLKKFYDDIINNSEKAIKKITEIIENIEYYVDAINDEKNKEAFKLCILQIKRILKNIKPKVCKGHLIYGSDDPASVGKIMAISGIIYPVFEDNLVIEGIFSEDILKGDIYIKGRVTIFVLIKAAWILYFNKDIKRMIKVFKRED